MSYCTRQDIEAIFGPDNVRKWADLDNRLDPDAIETRIDRAIVEGTSLIDDTLRTSRYVVPIEPVEGEDLSPRIVNLCATWAGVWLYQSRGAQDTNPDTGEPIDVLSWQRRKVMADLGAIRNGTMTIPAKLATDGGRPQVIKIEEPKRKGQPR